jgi:hypothetical protein
MSAEVRDESVFVEEWSRGGCGRHSPDQYIRLRRCREHDKQVAESVSLCEDYGVPVRASETTDAARDRRFACLEVTQATSRVYRRRHVSLYTDVTGYLKGLPRD